MITSNVNDLHKKEMKKVTNLEELIGPIKRFEGIFIGEYGAKLIAIKHDNSKQSIELSCGRLGAFDRETINDPNADYKQYCKNNKMNWKHMLIAGIQMPEKWVNHS